MKSKSCLFIVAGFLLLLPILAYFINKEVSTTFSDLDASLETTNQEIDQLNEELYLRLVEEGSQKNKALQVKDILEDMESHLDSIFNLLVVRSGGWKNEAEKSLKNSKSTALVNQFFIEEGNGGILMKKVELTREALLIVFKDELTPPDFPLTIDRTKLQSGQTWSEYKFKGMPLFAVMASLRKLLGDCKESKRVLYRKILK